MMPEEWPITAPAAERSAPSRTAGDTRLRRVRADFFLDPAKRLTEQERALMTAMLHGLVSDVADEIRSGLPAGWAAANDEADLGLIDRLTTSGLLDEPGLMALLLRRADEERIGAAARSRNGRRESRVIQGLVSHENAEVSAASMALILARGRRRDRFNQCIVLFHDLPQSTWVHLVHAVSACLRRELAATHGPAEADARLAVAADNLIGQLDSSKGAESLTSSVIARLEAAGALTDELVIAAAQEGEVGFVAQAIAHRAGLDPALAMDELFSGDADRLVALLRAADVSRGLAAGLLAAIGDLIGITDPGAAIDAFDRMPPAKIETARAWLTSAPAYREAVGRLGNGHG